MMAMETSITGRPARAVVGAMLICWMASAAPAQLPSGHYIDVRGKPEGPLGERVRDLVDVINSGRRMLAEAYVEDNFLPAYRDRLPLEEHLAFFAWAKDRSRGFHRYGVRNYPEGALQSELVIVLKNQLTDQWEGLVIEFESVAPWRIAGLKFLPVREPSQLPPPTKPTDEVIVEQVANHAKALAEADVFSGVVLVARGGKPLLVKAHGAASSESQSPITPESRFEIGPASMLFTGVAVTQLVQKAKVSSDDLAVKYLADSWVPREISRRVTIRQLLTHTSGLGDRMIDKVADSQAAIRTLADYKPFLAEERLANTPGKRTFFSRTGYIILGAIVEKVSGQSFCDYLGDNVFKPAGMGSTGCISGEGTSENLATRYVRTWAGEKMKWGKAPSGVVIMGGPAGGVFSTAGDLLKFDVALRNHKLLDAEHTRLVLSVTSDAAAPTYGHGFAIRGRQGNRIASQPQAGAGSFASFDMYLDSGYTAVVLSNRAVAAEAVAFRFAPLLDWPGE